MAEACNRSAVRRALGHGILEGRGLKRRPFPRPPSPESELAGESGIADELIPLAKLASLPPLSRRSRRTKGWITGSVACPLLSNYEQVAVVLRIDFSIATK